MRIVDLRELHIFANHDSERYAPVETEMMADRVDFREIERDSKREEPSPWNSDEALAWRRRSWRFYRHHSEVIELTPAGSVHEHAPHQVERGVHDRGRTSQMRMGRGNAETLSKRRNQGQFAPNSVVVGGGIGRQGSTKLESAQRPLTRTLDQRKHGLYSAEAYARRRSISRRSAWRGGNALSSDRLAIRSCRMRLRMMPPAILTRAAQARGETNYRWQSCPHDRTPKA